jgi:tetratricopeptide (TPR) repeat protein
VNIDDAERTNQKALEKLDEGDFFGAQALFRKNAKKHPAHLTFNNLGVYYVSEGMELRDGRMRSADKLGLKYLKTADALASSLQNKLALGGYYFRQGDYETAMPYYRAADGLADSYEASNNLGACLYLVGDMVGARTCFDKAFDLCESSDDKATILTSYAFALLAADRVKCLDVLNTEKRSLSLYLPDEFVLLYLCGEFEAASVSVMRLIGEYALDPPVVAMAFDCLLRLEKKDEAWVALETVLENLESLGGGMQRELARIRRAYESPEVRSELIAEYRYYPPIITPSCHIGYQSHLKFQRIVTNT